MNDDQRMDEALVDGYLASSPESTFEDLASRIWYEIAAREGFPLVHTVQYPQGVLVNCVLDLDQAIQDRVLQQARRAMKKASRGHRASFEEPPQKVGIMLVAGPFPVAAARALAHKLARLTGVTFPLAAYDLKDPV